MKMKRFIAMCLSSLMILMSFSSCGPSGVTSDTPANLFPDEEGTVEISFFNWELGRFATDVNEKPLPVYDTIAKKLDITVTPISAPWNTWEEALAIRMASDSVPDVFIHYGFDRREQFYKWRKDKLIEPIPEDEQTYPNLYKQLQKYTEFKPMMEDKFYGMPISYVQDEDVGAYIDHALFIRKDWLKKLGLKMPTTLKELENTIVAFTTQDPDGNGKNDTYGLGATNEGGAWWLYPYINMFDVDLFDWKKTDGKWVPDLLTGDMKSAFRWLTELYNKGALDKQFVTCSITQMTERFVTGKVGIMAHSAGYPAWGAIEQQFKSTYPDNVSTDMFDVMPVPVGITGKQRVNGSPNSWSMVSVSSQMSEKKKKKIFEMLDYMLSEEGLELLRYGIEGTHYTKNGNEYTLTLPKYDDGYFKTLADVDPSSEALKRMITWDKGFLPKNSVKNQELQIASAMPFRKASVLPATFYIPVKEEDFPSLTSSLLTDYVNTEVLKIISSPVGEFDSKWNKMIESWKGKGGTKFIEAMNKSASAVGK